MQLSPIESNHNLYQEDMKSKCNLLKLENVLLLYSEDRNEGKLNGKSYICYQIRNF